MWLRTPLYKRHWRTLQKNRQKQHQKTYDSITFQYRETGDEDAIIREALRRIRVELKAANGRSYIVPGEAKLGWNWGAQVTPEDIQRAVIAGKKPPRLTLEGLRKWNPKVPDSRHRAVGLKRVML